MRVVLTTQELFTIGGLAGVLHLNVRVPLTAAPVAAVPVELRLGKFRRQPGVTVSIG